MRKIVFCLQTMVLGGVEKELIAVLRQIHNRYDITLLLLYAEDLEILKDIPDNIKVKIIGIDKRYYCGSTMELIRQRIKNGRLLEAACIGIKRSLGIGMSHANTNIKEIPGIDEYFDLAICYHIHAPLSLKYVANNISASKKIAWIHNDFRASGYPVQKLKKYICKFGEFVAVSRKVENEFRLYCPWYSGSVGTAYNYLDVENIVRRSQEPILENLFLIQRGVKLLTIGRFTEQKGIDLAIEAATMLKKEGITFHWFLIGYGALENSYRNQIAKFGISDCFTILGKKNNPYPYIKHCDIYVQPSRHEAFGLVITEAKILRKPIVCTDFDGADEQIENGVNGIIVPLNDVEALYTQLKKLTVSTERRKELSRELEKWCPEDALYEIVKHFE